MMKRFLLIKRGKIDISGDIMDKEIIFLVEEDSESGFVAKALQHAIFTQGETIEELKTNIQDAVRCHFAPVEKPPIIRLHIVKDEVIPA